MKNREERPTNLDRGATQQTFDFGDEVEPTLPANFLRPEVTRSGIRRHAVPERLTRRRFDGAGC